MALGPSPTRELEAKYAKFARARRPFDIDVVLDCAFFAGHQYTIWHQPHANAPGVFRTAPREPGDDKSPRPISNKIYHFVMDSYASSKDNDPALEVRPTSVDAMDQSDARVAEAWLAHIADPTQANWRARSNAARFWAVLCGEGWNKWVFSPEKKRPDIEVCSPLEVYLPPNVASYLDAKEIIHARGMDPDEVYECWGVDLPASSVVTDQDASGAVLREIGMLPGTPTVLVKELWCLPCRRLPAGRFVIWSGDTILADGPFPYAHGMLPFTQIGHSPIPGTPHFSSGTKVMRPQQMALNKYDAQRMISEDNFANFKWFYDTALELSARPDRSRNQILTGDTRQGQIPPPTIIQAQVWPDSGNGEYIVDNMRDSVGLHEASTGDAPGRVDSATGIANLQEADRGRLSELEDTANLAMARGFGMLLELARQFMPEDQLVVDYSRSGAPAARRFKASQFPKQPMLRVVTDDGLPRNKAMRQAQIVAWYQAGIFGAPGDPAAASKVTNLLGLASPDQATGDQLDELDAWNENLLMLAGTPVTPHEWQNHAVHRRVHDECRKTAEFLSSPEKTWSVFQYHMDATTVVELQEIQAEAERQGHIAQVAQLAVPPPPPVPAPSDPSTPPTADAQPAPAAVQGPQPGAAQ